MLGMLIVIYQKDLQKMQQPDVKPNWENYWNTEVQIKKKKKSTKNENTQPKIPKKDKLTFLQLKKPHPLPVKEWLRKLLDLN